LDWVPLILVAMLPVLGLLMVSNVRYTHIVSYFTARGQFATLVGVVFIIVLVLIAPVPFLFLFFVGICMSGPVLVVAAKLRSLRKRPA
ncbi:MAG: hypothetical protein JRG82_18385, partial [Deltaproteobacteria bacterium]|nr:hypothetical protein [Deltaproteobacteria bacterium]